MGKLWYELTGFYSIVNNFLQLIDYKAGLYRRSNTFLVWQKFNTLRGKKDFLDETLFWQPLNAT